MSGHSKWSQIKRQKAVVDVKRGQVFSKLGKAISLAAKEGGSAEPEINYKLRMAVETARSVNMPKENIQRAIAAGIGKGATVNFEEATYEGFAQNGVAVIVEVVTDNKNRTVSEIKKIFDKCGGTLAGVGSVLWNFEKKGQIVVKLDKFTADEVFGKAAELGADDIEVGENSVEVYCPPEKLSQVRQNLADSGFSIESAELTMKPKSLVKIEDSTKATRILGLVDSLDNLDDVQKVYANFDIPDEILAKTEGNNP